MIAFREEDFSFDAGHIKLVYWERLLLWEFFYGCKPALQLVVFFECIIERLIKNRVRFAVIRVFLPYKAIELNKNSGVLGH